MTRFCPFGFLILVGLGGMGWAEGTAQVAAPQRIQVPGYITAIEGQPGRISIKADSGSVVTATVSDRTLLLHIPPGETDPKKGSKIPFTSLAVGDRVVAIGSQTADGKTVEASALLVMTKTDLSQLGQKQLDDWRKRGTTGTVTALDAAARTLTLQAGQRALTATASDGTEFRRYALDSARFSDAKPSSFAEIRMGDQVKVLGDKNGDGSVIRAEKIYSGSFRQVAATIKTIDARAGEIVATDLGTKKTLTLVVDSDSTMKKLPSMLAAMLARRYRSGSPGGARGAGGDIGQLLDRLPAMPLADLKAGDAIMVSTTQGSQPARVEIITLLAGVEPLLTASPSTTRDIMSGWNLGGGEGDQ